MSKEYTGPHLALAFLGGAAAGAAIAYFTAPKSGRELRADIRNYVDDRTHDMRQLVDDRTRGVRRLPDATRAAGQAAREAFDQTMHAPVEPPRQQAEGLPRTGQLPSNALQES